MRRVPSWEALYRDYAPKGVKFYYIYKSLAHPENGGYVEPFTLRDRLLHIKDAQRRIGGKIPWLCDTMKNDLKHKLGNAPTSAFLIDPKGKVARRWTWSNIKEMRRELVRCVGPVEKVTKPSDLKLKIEPPLRAAPHGVVKRIKVPRQMKPLVVKPIVKKDALIFYAKLRADTDEALYKTGAGKLYLGFHLDPLYHVHWNNLTQPIRVAFEAPKGVKINPRELQGVKVEATADVDPREFLVAVRGWTTKAPIHLTVRYYACNDKKGLCMAVTQTYTIHRELDRDAGWVRGRVYPDGPFKPPARKKNPKKSPKPPRSIP